jgi:hypothetical protein
MQRILTARRGDEADAPRQLLDRQCVAYQFTTKSPYGRNGKTDESLATRSRFRAGLNRGWRGTNIPP